MVYEFRYIIFVQDIEENNEGLYYLQWKDKQIFN